MSRPLQSLSAEPIVHHPSDVIVYGMDFSAWLPSGVTVASATATASPAGLTVGAPAANVATFVNGRGATVAIGKGVQVQVSGGSDGTDYLLTITATLSDGQVMAGVGKLLCRSS